MRFFIQQKFQKKIVKKLDYPFEILSPGLYAIFISARCQSARQRKSSDDEDLRIEIDTRKFREIPPDWADEKRFTFSVDNLRFYKL